MVLKIEKKMLKSLQKISRVALFIRFYLKTGPDRKIPVSIAQNTARPARSDNTVPGRARKIKKNQYISLQTLELEA